MNLSGNINYFCNFISFNKHESCNWKVMLLILKINFVNNFIHPSTGHLLFFFLKFVHIQCFSLFFFSLNFIFTSKFRRKQEVRGTPCFLPFWSSYISSVLSFLLCLSQFHPLEASKSQVGINPLYGSVSHILFAFTHTILSMTGTMNSIKF